MPFDGALDLIVNYYGIIPVNRGQLDRKAMSKAVSVLEQKGFLGIYPEGGIWFPGQMRTHIGVSLLSHRGQAKVVPIGFSGFRDSWNQAFSFKRPVLKMKVGGKLFQLFLRKMMIDRSRISIRNTLIM